MSKLTRPVLANLFALAAAGCDRASDINSKQSVTVQLPPARPYVAQPGFSLAAEQPIAPTAEQPETNKPSRT